jgi:hypothetical protein
LTQNSCFGVFRTVSLLHESRCKTARTGAINTKVRNTKSCRNFSQQTHPIPSIGPKTHVFRRFGPFCYCTKVDAKLSEWCHYRASSLNNVALEFLGMNAPDPLHLTQTSCFGAFWIVSLLHESRCKTARSGAINAQVRYTKSRPNFAQRTHPIQSIGPKTHVFGHFGSFRYCTKADAKLPELVPLTQKFAIQSRVGIFRNERTRSTPLDPKLMFCGVSDRFVIARKSTQNWTNWCHYRSSSLNKVVSEFFATNAPDPLHLTQNSYFGAFRTVSLLHESRCKIG